MIMTITIIIVIITIIIIITIVIMITIIIIVIINIQHLHTYPHSTDFKGSNSLEVDTLVYLNVSGGSTDLFVLHRKGKNGSLSRCCRHHATSHSVAIGAGAWYTVVMNGFEDYWRLQNTWKLMKLKIQARGCTSYFAEAENRCRSYVSCISP